MIVQRFYINQLEEGRVDGRGKRLSAAMVRQIHRLLHSALNHAVRLQLISRNPCDAVELPKVVRGETDYWTPDEVAQFLEGIKGDRLYALFYLALSTGLRRGELMGLRWEDIDFERRCLSVKQERVRGEKGSIFKEPKTKYSVRPIALSQKTIEVLKKHKVQQAREKLVMGDSYHDFGLVFTNVDGSPLTPWYISQRYFKKLIDKTGVRRISFHGLRHTHATMLGWAGISLKTISSRLRHSSVAITGDIYSHLLAEMDYAAAEAFDAALEEAKNRRLGEGSNGRQLDGNTEKEAGNL